MQDLPKPHPGILPSFKPKPKPEDTADAVAEAHGFTARPSRRKPGRKPSPRQFQLHPKVLPEIGEQVLAEAERLGITQGEFIERMWAAYLEQGKPGPR